MALAEALFLQRYATFLTSTQSRARLARVRPGRIEPLPALPQVRGSMLWGE